MDAPLPIIDRPRPRPFINNSATVPLNHLSTLSRLPFLIFDLTHQDASNISQISSQMNQMNEIPFRRPISTASTSSASMPRTPNSARSEYYWSDSGRPGPFVSEYDGPEELSTPATLTCSSAAEIIERPGSERWFDKDVVYKPSTSRIHSMTAPPATNPMYMPLPTPPSSTTQPELARGPAHSRSQSQSSQSSQSSQVRLWPQRPPLASTSSILEEEDSVLGLNFTANDPDPDTDSDTKSDNTESASEDGGLKRRRHIRRPGRAPPRLPRPLPPLPAGMTTLTHSQSTAGRFMTVSTENPLSASSSIAMSNPRDTLHRAYTTSWTTVKTPTSARLPPAKSPGSGSGSGSGSSSSVGKIPQLSLSTLGLRSTDSDASAVLVKTPNRKFNAPFSVAPPMPADAANTIDWDLLDDALEIDGDLDMHLHDAEFPNNSNSDRLLPPLPLSHQRHSSE